MADDHIISSVCARKEVINMSVQVTREFYANRYFDNWPSNVRYWRSNRCPALFGMIRRIGYTNGFRFRASCSTISSVVYEGVLDKYRGG